MVWIHIYTNLSFVTSIIHQFYCTTRHYLCGIKESFYVMLLVALHLVPIYSCFIYIVTEWYKSQHYLIQRSTNNFGIFYLINWYIFFHFKPLNGQLNTYVVKIELMNPIENFRKEKIIQEILSSYLKIELNYFSRKNYVNFSTTAFQAFVPFWRYPAAQSLLKYSVYWDFRP